MKKHIFAITAARSSHAVSRIALLFARRRIVLDSLVLTSVNEQTARIRLACCCDSVATQQLLAQLQRIVEIQSVRVEPSSEYSATELPSLVSYEISSAPLVTRTESVQGFPQTSQ